MKNAIYFLKYNKIKIENERLKNIIKEELYEKFMENVDQQIELERLRKENKKLRNQTKSLKEIIKGE